MCYIQNLKKNYDMLIKKKFVSRTRIFYLENNNIDDLKQIK